MVKDVDYTSLKESLDSKKYFSSTKEETKKESNYKTIKARLKGNTSKDAESPFQKADAILTYIQSHGWVGMMPEGMEDKRVQSKEGAKEYTKFWKDKVKNYSKEDVEEGILYRLNQLEKEGLQRERLPRKTKEGNYKIERSVERTWGGDVAPYEISAGLIASLDKILSSKRFLKKHGITSDEIKNYENTFKKRVGRILEVGVKSANSPERVEKAEALLKYAKKEGLINYKRTGLEKSLAVLSIGSVLAGIFFLSLNLTGNVVGNVAKNSTNLFGGILFILGIAGAFFTLRRQF